VVEAEPEWSRQDPLKLFAEVVVKPAVEKGIGASGRHAEEVTDGVDYEHLLFVIRVPKRVVHIEDKV